MSDKRTDYLSWDEYFMGVAMLSGMRSKDPNTQVGCCIVSQDNKILSMGYNGLPMGCSDDEFPWAREGEDPLETKYVYTTLDLNTNTVHPDIDGMKKALEDGNLYVITERMGNVLQDVTIPAYLEVERIKEQMKTLGAVNAMMSGSGPTVFGLFENRTAAREAQRRIREKSLAGQVYVTSIHGVRRN